MPTVGDGGRLLRGRLYGWKNDNYGSIRSQGRQYRSNRTSYGDITCVRGENIYPLSQLSAVKKPQRRLDVMAVVHLDVDDTSPTISYSPSSSTSSTDPVTGWTPCFSLSGCNTKTGTIPNGTSYYITADDDASFSLCWHGTGVQLMGNVSDTSHLNYTVYLDGNPVTPDLIDLSQQVLASFQNLPSQEHNVSLVVHASKSNVGFLAFNKATLTSPSPINGTGKCVYL